MKAFLILLALLAISGCTSRTEYGACIGIADAKDPALVYKLSVWNVFLGIGFAELIAPPIFVLANQTYCPTGKAGK